MWPLKIPLCRLPLSLVKPVISNQLVVTQAEGALHPDFVCWYNSCEDIADWTFANGGSGVNEANIKKEAVGSAKISLPVGPGGPYAEIDLSECDTVFGVWVRSSNIGGSPIFRVTCLGGGGAYLFQFYYDNAQNRWEFTVVHSTGSHDHNSAVVWANDTWAFLEMIKTINVNPAKRDYGLYIDGVNIWNLFAAGTIGGFDRFGIYTMALGSNVYIDYLRVSDRIEYPPT